MLGARPLRYAPPIVILSVCAANRTSAPCAAQKERKKRRKRLCAMCVWISEKGPLFQCEAGMHILCEVCVRRLDECPACRKPLPLPARRARAVESVVAVRLTQYCPHCGVASTPEAEHECPKVKQRLLKRIFGDREEFYRGIQGEEVLDSTERRSKRRRRALEQEVYDDRVLEYAGEEDAEILVAEVRGAASRPAEEWRDSRGRTRLRGHVVRWVGQEDFEVEQMGKREIYVGGSLRRRVNTAEGISDDFEEGRLVATTFSGASCGRRAVLPIRVRTGV